MNCTLRPFPLHTALIPVAHNAAQELEKTIRESSGRMDAAQKELEAANARKAALQVAVPCV
jgi:hypothetical protein